MNRTGVALDISRDFWSKQQLRNGAKINEKKPTKSELNLGGGRTGIEPVTRRFSIQGNLFTIVE
ncbi:MAG TPA: hypothetical protein VLM20_04400 [Methylophilaceae bacterium]|nr:hypothetical protein [Methylophilaceae bacterium]